MIGFILLILILLLPDLYVWNLFVRHCSWFWNIAYWIPFVTAISLMILVRSPFYQAWMFRVAMTLIIVFCIPKFLFTLISITGWLIARLAALTPVLSGWPQGISHGANYIGIQVAVLAIGIVIYGSFWGYKRVVINEVEMEFADLPDSFDGYRIVQLSDFHIGTYSNDHSTIEEVVAKVNAQKPDLIVFTGDIVNSACSELKPFLPTLSELKAKDGVYSIMGNHDYCMYQHYNKPSDRKKEVENLQQMERSMGWRLLLNEHSLIARDSDSIALIGVENSSRHPFPDYGNLPKAMAPTDAEQAEGITSLPSFKILLSHDPTLWRRKVLPETDIRLQLSGHTHATQFRLFGWSPAQHVYKEWGGLYDDRSVSDSTYNGLSHNKKSSEAHARKLFVCTGTGGNLAFRFGVWPEIVVITLRKAR